MLRPLDKLARRRQTFAFETTLASRSFAPLASGSMCRWCRWCYEVYLIFLYGCLRPRKHYLESSSESDAVATESQPRWSTAAM